MTPTQTRITTDQYHAQVEWKTGTFHFDTVKVLKLEIKVDEDFKLWTPEYFHSVLRNLAIRLSEIISQGDFHGQWEPAHRQPDLYKMFILADVVLQHPSGYGLHIYNGQIFGRITENHDPNLNLTVSQVSAGLVMVLSTRFPIIKDEFIKSIDLTLRKLRLVFKMFTKIYTRGVEVIIRDYRVVRIKRQPDQFGNVTVRSGHMTIEVDLVISKEDLEFVTWTDFSVQNAILKLTRRVLRSTLQITFNFIYE